MFKTVFNKLHEHLHTGNKITYHTFSQNWHIPYLEKWLSIFIHNCLECQRNKHFKIKIQTAPFQCVSEHAPFLITESLWIQKDLLILLDNINLTVTLSLTLSTILL